MRPDMRGNWLDRLVDYLAPSAGLRRARARVAAGLLARHYEAAAPGRRTQGWRASIADANAAAGPALARLRDVARDLVRNNPYAESALSTIASHAVGTGIVAKPVAKPAPAADAAAGVWRDWAETTACDADGQSDFYGLQQLITRTIVESGECLVRRRWRRPEDRLPLPLQLQVLEPDFVDTFKSGTLPDGGRIVNGVEFGALGQRVAYWLYREHPGSDILARFSAQSYRVPADGILHVYRRQRPGQVRGVSWFAPVLLKFKDFDEFEDATLVKQKIAACLAVLTSAPDGGAAPLGVADDASTPGVDSIEPGMIVGVTPGSDVHVVTPPPSGDYPSYAETQLRAIATGLGVNYEDLTGDYGRMSFSAARLSRLRHWARVQDWRWQMLIPGLCDPVWRWAMDAAAVAGVVRAEGVRAEWTAPPLPLADPANEGLAYQRNVRAGIMSLSEALRERGYDPRAMLEEMSTDARMLDELGLVLDSDPRRTTQAGNPVPTQPAL